MSTHDPRTATQIRNGYTVRPGLEIESVARTRSSVNGNPAWLVRFTDSSVARTSPDASVGYSADNRDQHGVPLDVVFTRAGLIAYWRFSQD